jgi:hypothetical protein
MSRRQDGTVSYLEGFVEDISQQKRISKALEESGIRHINFIDKKSGVSLAYPMLREMKKWRRSREL